MGHEHDRQAAARERDKWRERLTRLLIIDGWPPPYATHAADLVHRGALDGVIGDCRSIALEIGLDVGLDGPDTRRPGGPGCYLGAHHPGAGVFAYHEAANASLTGPARRTAQVAP